MRYYLHEYAGRETPLYFAERLTEKLGGAKIYLKREDLCHTGAHKINNTIGQILLARRMGKQRIIAETGAGQHGVATATVAARFGLECEIFMGKEDVQRQSLNVFRMKLLGAKVRVVESGSQTLKDAMNEALRDWVTNVRNTYYLIGSVAGPASLSDDGARFSIGDRPRSAPADSRKRRPAARLSGRLRRRRQQCDGTIFSVRATIDRSKCSASRRAATGSAPANTRRRSRAARSACCTAARAIVLQDDNGQITETHSVAAGLDYPGVGPELSYLRDRGRVQFDSATDRRSHRRDPISRRSRRHHSGAGKRPCDRRRAPLGAAAAKRQIIIVNLSGRGDKDMMTVGDYLGVKL